MEVVTLILSIVAIVIGVINTIIVIVLMRRTKRIEEELTGNIKEIKMNTEINDLFTHRKGESTRKITELSRKIFYMIKESLDLKASTYSEMIEEIKKSPKIRDEELRKLLIDFFQDLIIINYQTKSLNPEKKERFKEKLLVIAKKLELL